MWLHVCIQAVGEPPLFLAASVFYAIKDAIASARAESGLIGPFRLDSPATPERIRNACEDRFTKLVCSNFHCWLSTIYMVRLISLSHKKDYTFMFLCELNIKLIANREFTGYDYWICVCFFSVLLQNLAPLLHGLCRYKNQQVWFKGLSEHLMAVFEFTREQRHCDSQ